MVTNRWADIADMALHPDKFGYSRELPGGGFESWSHEGMDSIIRAASIESRYSEALAAFLETRSTICVSHNRIIDTDRSWWGLYDYGYDSGWVGDGYPDFFYFGIHATDAEPWCCIELWGHGLPSGDVIGEVIP